MPPESTLGRSSDSAMNKWVALASLVAATILQPPAPVVQTTGGLVRGRLSEDGKFYQYYGIPYATVNESNRFKAPLPGPKWDGIFEAVDESVRCPQKMVGSMIMGDVDCLKVSIYSPIGINPTRPLPVMVFIHGGCFKEGTGSGFLYGGDYFTEYGVIFVGINYRLNVEGFLCLGIEEAPGNAGLKDQLAALRWIKKNIKSFGGDPDNITLFGESAGAVSTTFMMLSNEAKGLFHKAILQSGATFGPWALQHDPIQTASKLAKELGYNTKDPHELYKIISRRSHKELINAVKSAANKTFVTHEMLFVPCVEKDIPEAQPLVTEHPAHIIAAGNYHEVPMIIGFNDNEGIYFVAKDFGVRVPEVDVADILQNDLVFPHEEDKNKTVEKLFNHYFYNLKPGSANITLAMINFYSDLFIKMPAVFESKLFAARNTEPIYYYLFKYDGYINMAKLISLYGGVKGASHADELFYLFKPHSFPLPQRYLDITMIKRMLSMWTNFAKFGAPIPEPNSLLPVAWKPSKEPNPVALVIDRNLTTMPLFDEPAVELWSDIYNKYRRRQYGFDTSNRV